MNAWWTNKAVEQITSGHFLRKVATAKAVWSYCSSRTGLRPCTRTASFHQSSSRWLVTPERLSTPVLATSSRSWSQATQLWPPYSMSACGRSFRLAECRGNGQIKSNQIFILFRKIQNKNVMNWYNGLNEDTKGYREPFTCTLKKTLT